MGCEPILDFLLVVGPFLAISAIFLTSAIYEKYPVNGYGSFFGLSSIQEADKVKNTLNEFFLVSTSLTFVM